MDLQSLNDAATDNKDGYDNSAMADSPTDPSQVAIEEANGNSVGEGYELPSVQFESPNGVNGLSSPVDSKSNSSPVPPGSPLGCDRSEHITSVHYPDADGDGDEQSLMYKRYEPIRSKDFASEVRAFMDVEQFISQAQLILDLPETNLADIIDHMLSFMVIKGNTSWTESEAKQELFTHDSGSPCYERPPLESESGYSKKQSDVTFPCGWSCSLNDAESARNFTVRGPGLRHDGYNTRASQSVHQLKRTVQGAMKTEECGFDYDQHWVCVMCTLATTQTRSVCIARLRTPANLSRTLQEARFIILIVAPLKEKSTKNALETARTFATLFNDMELRSRLQAAHSMETFKNYLLDHAKELASDHQHPEDMRRKSSVLVSAPMDQGKKKCWFTRHLQDDFRRRLKLYVSDYKDGVLGPGTLYKTLSTIIFFYFAILLPSIALGELNSTNTGGKIDVKKVIYSQFMGGLYFAVFGGQPMIILLTTAPLALYTKVVFTIAEDMEVDFLAMYACTGLWNMFFLFIYSFCGASIVMKWSTRSTEEIFALFISIAFTVDACRGVTKQFDETYNSGCNTTMSDVLNATNGTTHGGETCEREKSILYLLLVLGTVWLGLYLFNFTKTPFLNAGKRELMADFALPVSVIVLSFFGSYVFRDINLNQFSYENKGVFVPDTLSKVNVTIVFTSMGLGFCLSLLFFMDQNISGAMVNSPENRLKKGTAYHWDLFVVGLLNGALTLFGLPMIHGALPHSPLHVLAMATVEDRVEGGVIKQKVVYVRENRVTGVVVHILIGVSLLMLPYPLAYIPPAVLDGLFLYLAVTALNNNQLFERLTLLFTEQAQYPPNHYISRVPQRKVHQFTLIQLLQLAVLCGFGFAPMPYLKMVFPVLIFLMLPVRHKIIPFLIDRKYLNFMDSSVSH